MQARSVSCELTICESLEGCSFHHIFACAAHWLSVVAAEGRSSLTEIPRIELPRKGDLAIHPSKISACTLMRRHIFGPCQESLLENQAGNCSANSSDPSHYQVLIRKLTQHYVFWSAHGIPPMVACETLALGITDEGKALRERSRNQTSDLLSLPGDVSCSIARAQVGNTASVIIRKLATESQKVTMYQVCK